MFALVEFTSIMIRVRDPVLPVANFREMEIKDALVNIKDVFIYLLYSKSHHLRRSFIRP